MCDDGATAGRSPWSSSGRARVDSDGQDDGNASSHPRAPLNLPKTPRKMGRKPPVKGNKRETLSDIARRVPVSVMREYFNFSLRQAADAMSISVTSLKRLCRRHGVRRWPHRQLSGLNRAVAHLEGKQQASSDPSISEQLDQLYSRREVVIDRAFTSDDACSEPTRDSPSRSDNEEGDVLMDSGHQEALEQEAGPAPSYLAGSLGMTIAWRQREQDTSPWRHHQQHQQHQHQQHQHQQHQHQHQQQEGSSGHGRGSEAGEGAKATAREDYLAGGWGGSSNDRTDVSTGRRQRDFRASHVPPSSAVALAPESRPGQGQAGRCLQSPPSRAASAAEVATATAPGRSDMATGTNPSRRRENGSSLQTHVASLPQDCLGVAVQAPVTKIALLNALLLGGGPSDGPADPTSLSRARATAGGTHPRRRRCSESPEGEAWGGRQNDSSSGPVPSIARLVEAGAMLSGAGDSDWRRIG